MSTPKLYRVVQADPPWSFRNKGGRQAPSYVNARETTRGAHYDVASQADIMAIGDWLPGLCHDDSILFLWAPHAMVISGEATEVARRWGFEPKQEIVWCKTTKNNRSPAMGMGNYTRLATEPLLLCKRGKPKRLRADILNIFFAPRTKHSAKPDHAYQLIEDLFEGPYLELFARKQYSEQWDTWGDEAPNPIEVAA